MIRSSLRHQRLPAGDPGSDRALRPVHAEDGGDHADVRDDDPQNRLPAGSAHRRPWRFLPHHEWALASFTVVGVMSIIALGLIEPANIAVLPANIAVLFELQAPQTDGPPITVVQRSLALEPKTAS